MAAAFLAGRLEAVGLAAQVSSAGTRQTDLGVDPEAVRAAADLGFDISGHRPRALSRQLVDDFGADLVVTMTRRHLREVATTSRDSFARTFTLRDLARRLDDQGLITPGAPVRTVLTAISGDRRPSHLIADDPEDDIGDPYGTGRVNVRRTARELDHLAQDVAVGFGRWA